MTSGPPSGGSFGAEYLIVQTLQQLGLALDIEVPLDMLTCRNSHAPTKRTVRNHFVDRLGQSANVAWRDEQARLPVKDDFRNPAQP